ncbi:hypothetical protein MKW98_001406 [Papaver atlanticum]|uniref:Uncharacterized protein n=1 Tax=Papaver atlanticum TaxID=357466 RepID=A0AAD4SP32_9MAGN|nr:hypothetical protein MKW98_001406 [Papaver atlanticum]
MATISSSSSSSFSFLIVLSVLVVSNNVPMSHGQNLPVGLIPVNSLGSVLPNLVSGKIVDLTLIVNTLNGAAVLVQNIETSLNAVTRNVLVISSRVVGPITSVTPTILNQVSADVCSLLRSVNLGSILFADLNTDQVTQILSCV